MKPYRILSFILFSIVIFIIFAAPAFAATPTGYVPLAPLPNTTVQDGSTDLATYLPNIFKLLIAIAGGLAALVMIIGGVQYLSTDAISGKEDGKERMTNALVGLILAIASWLILNTINPGTLTFNLSLQRIPAPATTTSPTSGAGGGTGTAISCTRRTSPTCWNFYSTGTAWPDDASVRSQLNSSITVTGTAVSTPCKTVSEDGCTSLYGLPGTAISGLNNLATNCPSCIIIVTGGTEFWKHWYHGPGYAQVDLSFGNQNSDSIYRFLQNNTQSGATPVSSSSCIPNSNYSAWNLNGAIYVLEVNHWHVCY